MIDSEDAKDVLIKVIDTEPNNRSWVLSLILNIILVGACIFCYSRMINAENREFELSKKLDLQKSLNLSDSKDCLKAIRNAEKNKDLEWSVKVDNLQTIYNKELKEKAEKLEQQIKEINKRVGK